MKSFIRQGMNKPLIGWSAVLTHLLRKEEHGFKAPFKKKVQMLNVSAQLLPLFKGFCLDSVSFLIGDSIL